MSTDLTLVQATISFGRRAQNQTPIIRLLKDKREPRVARVRVQADRQQMKVVAASAKPGYLQSE